MATNAKHLSAALGLQVRKLRTDAGVRQDDIAEAARSLGLDWTRSVVAALESGRRQLAAEEMLLLPLILSRVSIDAELPAMLEAAGSIRLGGSATIPGRRLAQIARGEPAQVRVRMIGNTQMLAEAKGSQLLGPERDEVALEVAERLHGDTKVPQLLKIERTAGGEAEQRAARRLEVSPLIVALVAHHLWGRSLTAERDARHTAALSDSLAPNKQKALRGWVTRQLIAELEPAVHEALEGS